MNRNLKWGGALFVYLFIIFFIHGCGTPEERAIKVPGSDSINTNAENVRPTGPELHVVEIKDMKFQPESLSVKRGDTIMWINHDMVTHCVTEEKTKAWTSSNIPANASWKMVFKNNADYFCAIHQVMKGKITVQ